MDSGIAVKWIERNACQIELPSMAVPEHKHSCRGSHWSDGDHYCNDCGYYWYVVKETEK